MLASPGDASMNTPRRRWYVVALLLLGYTLSYIDRQLLSLLVEPIKRDLQISDSQIGLLHGFAFSIFYIIAGLPLARWVDTGNRRNITAICIGVWSLMTAGCGLAQNYISLLLMRIGVAIGEAGLPPAAFSLFSDLFDKEKVARATTLFMAGPYIGSGLALLLGGLVFKYFEGVGGLSAPVVGDLAPWQATFVAIGLPGVFLALVVLLTIREPARREYNETDSRYASSVPIRAVIDYLLQRREFFIGHIVGSSLVALVIYSHIVWVPAFLIRRFEVSAAFVGVTYGGPYIIVGVFGALAAGLLPQWMRGENTVQRIYSVILFATIAMLFPITLAPLMPSYELSVALLLASVFCYSVCLSLVPVPIQLLAPNRMRGQFTALLALVTGLVGVGLGPVLVGLSTDFLFHDEKKLHLSLALVSGVVTPFAIFVFTYVQSQLKGKARRSVSELKGESNE